MSIERSPMSIFDERVHLKPYEYPHLLKFKTAIRQSYWVHDEFNFEGDVQDFHVNCTAAERSVITKTMLAIAQVEVAVKTFWADIYNRLPVPEVGAVGMTFAESEVRHLDAYSHLLEVLGLSDRFERIEEISALHDRVQYLNGSLEGVESGDDRDFAQAILLFSIFIEHVSLFSQFLVMLSFDKYEKRFKGVANAVEATSKEEQIHGLFGVELIDIFREEHPEWFEQEVQEACRRAYDAEQRVLDWIFAEGELEFLPRPVVDAFLRDKFNESLKNVEVNPIFEVDPERLDETRWFYEEILLTKGNDFFSKRSTSYSKMTQMAIIDQAGGRQKHIDQSQSINLAIDPKSTPVKDINRLYVEAWRKGVKSLYYQHGVNAAQSFSREILSCRSCEA